MTVVQGPAKREQLTTPAGFTVDAATSYEMDHDQMRVDLTVKHDRDRWSHAFVRYDVDDGEAVIAAEIQVGLLRIDQHCKREGIKP